MALAPGLQQRFRGQTYGLPAWPSVRPSPAHARIDHAVQHVDKEIRRKYADGREEEDGLHQRIVSVADRLEHEPPHARIVEDLLDEDRPADDAAERDRE